MVAQAGRASATLTPVPPPPSDMQSASDDDAGITDDDAVSCRSTEICPITTPGERVCGEAQFKTETETVLSGANVLVVFDRSGSMEADWGGAPKYQAAGNALLAALTTLKDHLTVGGVFFPSALPETPNTACPNGCDPLNLAHWLPGIGGCCLIGSSAACAVSDITSADQINFTTAETFIQGLPTQWHLLTGGTGTPLEAGIKRAAEAIRGRVFADPLLVIVMTDGEPNCGTSEDDVLEQVALWRAANISTYVVGLPGATGAAELLAMMADAGGTGKFIEPRDPLELQQRLRSVISSSVRRGFNSCTFQLAPATEAPAKLRLFTTQSGQEREVAPGAAPNAQWAVNETGDQVVLANELCAEATSGRIESLRFVFGCKDLPPPLPELF
jgi:uncharacterized protein YegL